MADHTARMYAFCGSFFSELKAAGVEHAVVSPGARSAPLVVSADRAGVRIWIQIDERSGGFFGLGLAKALREPVALICTSGTAAANYLPSVIEANRTGVPLVVLTADRPPELRGWGSNQTIDQRGLYGSNTRWSVELPVADEGDPRAARRFAVRAVAEAVKSPSGPVHLNFPFRSPLSPDDSVANAFPPPESPMFAAVGVEPGADGVAALTAAISEHERGLILAGATNPGTLDTADMLELSARSGWPILAEPTSQLRLASPAEDAAVISTTVYLTRQAGFAAEHRPDVLVLIGAAPPHRAIQRWLQDQSGCRVILLGDGVEWADESLSFTDALRADPGRLVKAVLESVPVIAGRTSWPAAWKRADEKATTAIGHALIESEMFEGRIVTAIAGVLPDDASLYVGNSMALRDVNLYWPRRAEPIDIYSNRGASGIDGLVSSATGVAAATDAPVVLLLGDLSLLHDLSGLLAAVRLQIPLVIVVSNNDGGGIFSFLPIGDFGDAIRFDELFHTPHGADLGAVVRGVGARHVAVESSTEIQQAIIGALERTTPSVIEVKVDAQASVVRHRHIDAAVGEALSSGL